METSAFFRGFGYLWIIPLGLFALCVSWMVVRGNTDQWGFFLAMIHCLSDNAAYTTPGQMAGLGALAAGGGLATLGNAGTNPANVDCNKMIKNLIDKLMLRSAFSSSELRDLAHQSGADFETYSNAAGQLARHLVDSLFGNSGEISAGDTDFERATRIFNEMSRSGTDPFVHSIFEQAKDELSMILQFRGSIDVGWNVGGTYDGTSINNPSGDLGVESHEGGHDIYKQDHGSLDDTASVSGEGSDIDYTQGSEQFAYDEEIRTLIDLLNESGCFN